MERPVSVVRLLVPNGEGKVLVLRRSNTRYGHDRWALPGGIIDFGETAEAGAARELEEETGLRCARPRFLFYLDSLPSGTEPMHCINFYFECDASGDLRLGDEASEAAWIGVDELERFDLVFGNDAGVRRYMVMRTA